jgi:hypothetical protein
MAKRTVVETPRPSVALVGEATPRRATACVVDVVMRTSVRCSSEGRAVHATRRSGRRCATPAFLAGILEGEFQATYRGPEWSEYVRVLTEIVTGLGGSVDAGAIDLAATFEGRRIAIRFGTR